MELRWYDLPMSQRSSPSLVLVLVLLCTMLVAAACGTSSSTAPGSSGTPAVSTSPTTVPTLAVTPGAGDASVNLRAVTYPDAANPCAGLVADTSFASAPAACQTLFATIYATLIPGQDAAGYLRFPSRATSAAGIAPQQATSSAEAFVRSQALTWWAAFHNQLGLLTDLDGAYAGQDAILSLLRSGGALENPPSCLAPTTLTVVHVKKTALTYLEGHGWSSPSTLGIVATYPVCSGVKVSTGVHSRIFGVAAAPYSVLLTGTVQSDPVISTTWMTNGVAQCGVAEVESTCRQ